MGKCVSIAEALRKGVAALQQARVAEPRLTAEVLLGHILERDRAFLYAHGDEPVPAGRWARYLESLERRCSGTPTQYITGVQEFYGLSFRVAPGVLIPRPETELLVEQTLARAAPGDRILDIGTGSGAIAIALRTRLPEARVHASDISRDALRLARQNSIHLRAPISLIQADLADVFRPQSFDIIACNPPYVSLADLPALQREVRDHEPHEALFGGEDGLDSYRRLSTTAAEVLRPGGWLLMEVGYNTSAAIKPLFSVGAWDSPCLYRDLAGWERVMAVQRVAVGARA